MQYSGQIPHFAIAGVEVAEAQSPGNGGEHGECDQARSGQLLHWVTSCGCGRRGIVRPSKWQTIVTFL
jgi:hypothetical protein